MMSSVPQFIDVEDKIAGPLTWKQLAWMIGLGTILLVLYNVFPTVIFFIVSVPIVILFSALAFYRPYNQPLILYMIYATYFLFRPKIAVWERPVAGRTRQRETAPEPSVIPQPRAKKVTLDELHALAKVVDNR
jgi:hypothetical protein